MGWMGRLGEGVCSANRTPTPAQHGSLLGKLQRRGKILVRKIGESGNSNPAIPDHSKQQHQMLAVGRRQPPTGATLIRGEDHGVRTSSTNVTDKRVWYLKMLSLAACGHPPMSHDL